MSQSKSGFSKFTFKPSALSQHTANFNKQLEQLPAPKIESLNLAKPVLEKPNNQGNFFRSFWSEKTRLC